MRTIVVRASSHEHCIHQVFGGRTLGKGNRVRGFLIVFAAVFMNTALLPMVNTSGSGMKSSRNKKKSGETRRNHLMH